MKVLPYVYKLINEYTTEYYIGYRSKNVRLNLRAEDDIGKKYFTSSKYVRPRFSEFKIVIIAEFWSKDDAYDYEQTLIAENINNINCLNKHYQNSGTKKFKHNTPHSKQAKDKMRGKRGKIKSSPRTVPPWNKGLTKYSDSRVTKMSISRTTTGNPQQVGKKYSIERIQKIKEKLTGRKMTPQQIEKMSIAKKGKTWEEIYGKDRAIKKRQLVCKGPNHHNSKKINTPDGIFMTITNARKHFGVSDYTVRNRCNSLKDKWKAWSYIISKDATIG